MKKDVISYLFDNTELFDFMVLCLKSQGGVVRFVDEPFCFGDGECDYKVYEVFYDDGGVHIMYTSEKDKAFAGVVVDHLDDVNISPLDYNLLVDAVIFKVCGTVNLKKILHKWVVDNYSIDAMIRSYPPDVFGEWAADYDNQLYIEDARRALSEKD